MPRKISQLEAATDVTASDLIQIVDIEDTGMAVSGTNKKVTAQLLANELADIVSNGGINPAKLSSGALPSGITATATGSTTARTLANRFADVVNVKDFGAVGDGVTDDTAAIVLAASSGSRIYLPSGTYIFSNSTMPSEFDFVGAGSGKTTILWKAASASSNMMRVSGVVDVRFADITIDSNRQNQTDSTGYYGAVGGTIGNGSKIIFDRVEFKNGRITDVVLVGPTGAGQFAIVEFNQCQFYDGLVGTDTRAAQAVSVSEGIRLSATGNTFRQPNGPASYGRGGLVMQRQGGSTSLSWGQFNASNNNFDNFGRGTLNSLGSVYVYSGSELTTITGNIFRNVSGPAITVKSDCGNTTVMGNAVYGTVNNTNAGAFSFFQQADTLSSSLGRNLVISGNTIEGESRSSIFVDGDRVGSADLKGVVIANNICKGGVNGIQIRNIEEITITGNLIQNQDGSGIVADGPVAGIVSITENIISSETFGIFINGQAELAKVYICNNKINDLNGDSGYAVRIPNVNLFDISNNNIGVCFIAFATLGASEISCISNNKTRGASAIWSKGGSYGILVFNDNITSVNLGFTGLRSQVINGGVITVFADWHYVDTEGGAGTDDLTTIAGGYEGRRLVLFAANNSRDVVLKDGTGNLRLAGDYTLTHADDSIELVFCNDVWVEISRSDNNA